LIFDRKDYVIVDHLDVLFLNYKQIF
jgi:hypothetical protein